MNRHFVKNPFTKKRLESKLRRKQVLNLLNEPQNLAKIKTPKLPKYPSKDVTNLRKRQLKNNYWLVCEITRAAREYKRNTKVIATLLLYSPLFAKCLPPVYHQLLELLTETIFTRVFSEVFFRQCSKQLPQQLLARNHRFQDAPLQSFRISKFYDLTSLLPLR